MEVKKTPAGEPAADTRLDHAIQHTSTVPRKPRLVSSLTWHLWAITKSSKRDLMGEDAARL